MDCISKSNEMLWNRSRVSFLRTEFTLKVMKIPKHHNITSKYITTTSPNVMHVIYMDVMYVIQSAQIPWTDLKDALYST